MTSVQPVRLFIYLFLNGFERFALLFSRDNGCSIGGMVEVQKKKEKKKKNQFLICTRRTTPS